MCRYPAVSQGVAFGEVGVYGAGKDLAIVTYGNGHYLSRQAEQALRERGVDLRIIDLRWLSPLPEAALLEAADGCRRVLIVDECRRSGNLSEALMALFVERTRIPAARVAAPGFLHRDRPRLCRDTSFKGRHLRRSDQVG